MRATERIELETRNATPVLPVSGVEGDGSEPPTPYVGSPERSNTVNPVSYLRALSPERPTATNIIASDPSAPVNALGLGGVLTDGNALAPVPVTGARSARSTPADERITEPLAPRAGRAPQSSVLSVGV